MADLIDELVGMEDADLSKKLGLDDKVKEFRENLAKASKLEGDNRNKVLKTLKHMFTPHDYAINDIGYELDHIERKEKTGCTPCEMVKCVGDCD